MSIDTHNRDRLQTLDRLVDEAQAAREPLRFPTFRDYVSMAQQINSDLSRDELVALVGDLEQRRKNAD